ncbi:PH domain-containing protein [Altererythrobacter sp. BO-6]|uniref:PH domain-containing protein n=1 Tax=Altererythrobacter sp. BO-6 TaxID=2604537 RepID=UPI0013E104E9|nr:PH domain-containing protein [Altererythrobacter sp. BO-6]QIG54351.1 PH domain-containing protein [Altererythrobacter sp. BO-6]
MDEHTPASPPAAPHPATPAAAPATTPVVDGHGDEQELTPLHPNYRSALRVEATLTSIPFIIGALVLESAEVLPKAVIIGPVALIALLVILRLPMRRFAARGYAMSTDRLRVVRGLLFRHDTVVPFGRVQHIDVNQGPIERFFGIATLTLHTAGTHNASVNLPGLGETLARDMREEIRSHIKREAL